MLEKHVVKSTPVADRAEVSEEVVTAADHLEGLEEGTALIDRNSGALVSFASSLLGGEARDGHRKKGLLMRFMEDGFLLIGITGGVPYIYSAEHATDDKVLAGFFIAGVLITGGSNGAWIFWSLNKKLDQLAEPYRKETRGIYEDQLVSQRVKHPIVNVVSIVSTLPYVYKTYLYNDVKWFALLDFFISYGYKALGYYNFWDALQASYSLQDSEHTSAFRTMQKALRRRLRKEAPYFLINLSPDQASQTLSTLVASLDERGRNGLNVFIDNVLSLDTASSGLLPTTWLRGYPRKVFVASSVIIPINFSIVNGAFAYYGARRIVDNRIFAWCATGLSTIPTFVVDLSVTAQTFETFFDYIFNRIHGSRTSPYEVFYPNALVKCCVPLLAFGISVLAASNNIYSTRTFLSSLPEFEGTVDMFTWSYAIANIIFSTYTLIKLAGVGLRKYAGSFGTDSLKQLYTRFFDAVDQVDSFVARLTPQMFERFVHGLQSPDVERKLLQITQKPEERVTRNSNGFFAQPNRPSERGVTNEDECSDEHNNEHQKPRHGWCGIL